MKDPKNLEKLTSLAEFIETFYGGDQEYLRKELVEIVFMLHYIDPQSFDQMQVQEKSFLLHRLAECLTNENGK